MCVCAFRLRKRQSCIDLEEEKKRMKKEGVLLGYEGEAGEGTRWAEDFEKNIPTTLTYLTSNYSVPAKV